MLLIKSVSKNMWKSRNLPKPNIKIILSLFNGLNDTLILTVVKEPIITTLSKEEGTLPLISPLLRRMSLQKPITDLGLWSPFLRNLHLLRKLQLLVHRFLQNNKTRFQGCVHLELDLLVLLKKGNNKHLKSRQLFRRK